MIDSLKHITTFTGWEGGKKYDILAIVAFIDGWPVILHHWPLIGAVPLSLETLNQDLIQCLNNQRHSKRLYNDSGQEKRQYRSEYCSG